MSLVKKIYSKYKAIPLVARATLWLIVCSTMQKCMSLITTPIFTRLMTQEQYGQFTVYNSWLQIITIITTLRLDYSVFNKGMSKYKDDRDSYTSTMQTITFMITLFVFIIYLAFHNFINELVELPTFIMVAMFSELLVFPAVNFWTIRKRYEYIYVPVVIRTFLMVVLNAIIGVVAVIFCEEKGYARIMSCIGVNFVFGIILFISNFRKAKKKFVWEYAKFAVLFNLPMLMHYLSQYVLDQFDRIMIQKMEGLGVAAIYGVAYNAGLIVKVVSNSLHNALTPWQYDKLEKKDFKTLNNTMMMIFVAVGVCTVLFSAFAPELLMILADKKYYEAIYVIPPVAVGMYFNFVYTTVANVELFFERNKFTMYISMAGAVLNIGLNYVGIKLFGYVAAAYTTLICYIIFSLGHYIYMTYSVKKLLDVKKIFDGKTLILISTAILSVGILVAFMYKNFVLRYAFIAACIVVCIIERNYIIDIVKSVSADKKAKKKENKENKEEQEDKD